MDAAGMWEDHPFHGLLPVAWPEAKPKTSRTDYGKRLSRETSRFSDQIMARGQADKPPVSFLFYVLTSAVEIQWITNGRWTTFAALHPYYLIAFDLVNCSCAPSADGSVTTGDDADLDDDISTGRNWIELQQIQFLRYNRAISLGLILRSAFTLHPYYIIVIAFDLVNCSCTPSADGFAITGFLRWQFYMPTSRDQLGLQQIQALHYISTTSLRLILWIAFALHPYFFTDSSAVQDHFQGDRFAWTSRTNQEITSHIQYVFDARLHGQRLSRKPPDTTMARG